MRNYTRQDVFKHKESGKILLFSCYDDTINEDDCDEAILAESHCFAEKDNYNWYKLNDVTYLGRTSKSILVDDAKINNEYYICGGTFCSGLVLSKPYILGQIDKLDSELPFRSWTKVVGNQEDGYIWFRNLLTVPFDAILSNLDLVGADRNSVVATTLSIEPIKTIEINKVSQDSNFLAKQPKPLI